MAAGGVCRAARRGVKQRLRKLPGLVVSGGRTGVPGVQKSEVWRLDLEELRWGGGLCLTSWPAAHFTRGAR